MSDLSELEQKAQKSPAITIRHGMQGRKPTDTVAHLGLSSSENEAHYIPAITVEFDGEGNAITATLPNHISSSPNTKIELSKAPDFKHALLQNASLEGVGLLAGIGKTMRLNANTETNHYDPSQSLGINNPDAARRNTLRQELRDAIAARIPKEAWTSPFVQIKSGPEASEGWKR